MSKNMLFVGFGIVLLAAGAFYFLSGQKAEAPTGDAAGTVETGQQLPPGMDDGTVTEDTGFDVLISFTGTAYEPNMVTIKKGDTVRFLNNGTSPTWPASAMHPDHTKYPEKTSNDCLGSAFDACRGLKSGESWDFTFNSVGEWGFHDHLNPKMFGKITVTE